MPDYDIAAAFARIEDELISSMKRNMKHHLSLEADEGINYPQWQSEQLEALDAFKRRNAKKYGVQFASINQKINDTILATGNNAALSEERRILRAIQAGAAASRSAGVFLEFFGVNGRKMDALVKATTSDMAKAEQAMLRMANDQYRKTIFGAQVYLNSGAGSLKQAIDMAQHDFLSAGFNCVEYKNGRRVNIKSYSEMALRTANTRAMLYGEGQKRNELGIHIVRITAHGTACPMCVEWQGKAYVDDVYSGGTAAEGTEFGLPLLSTAIAGGMFHPNCRNGLTTYFPEIDRKNLKEPDDETKQKQVEHYNNIQMHNYYRNNADRFHRLAIGSVVAENVNKYLQKEALYRQKAVDISGGGGIMNAGAFSGAKKTLGWQDRHAELMYEEIRHRSTDVKHISENTPFKESAVEAIKQHMFFKEHKFADGTVKRFDSDYDQVQAWDRLSQGRGTKTDIEMLKHEYVELTQMRLHNYDYETAHEIANSKHNWWAMAEKE